MQTSIFNCPVCKQGNLIITEINDVVFEPNEDHISPQKINITGVCKCNNCGAAYELRGNNATMR